MGTGKILFTGGGPPEGNKIASASTTGATSCTTLADGDSGVSATRPFPRAATACVARPDGSHPQVLSAMISSSRHGSSPDSGPARFYPTCPTGRADPEVPPTCPTGRLARVYPTCPTGRVPDFREVLGGIAGHRRGRTLRGGPSRTRLLLYLLQLAPPPFA